MSDRWTGADRQGGPDRGTRAGSGWRVVAVLAGLAVAAQLWGLYRVTGPPTPGWFPDADKLEHAAGFALPVGLLVLALGLRRLARGRTPSRTTLVVVVAVFAAHAVLSEVVQHLFYTGRSGDPRDVLADVVGIALGAVVATALLRRAVRRSWAGVAPGRRPTPAEAT
jgi:VanZ family protein